MQFRLTRLLCILVALTMVTTAFAAFVPMSRDAAASGKVIADPEPLDMGPQIRAQGNQFVTAQGEVAVGSATALFNPSETYAIGDQVIYYLGDYGKSVWMTFTKKVDGDHCEVWTQNDMTFPDGDARNENMALLTISDQQAQYMADQFDNNIYPTEKTYFSDAPPADGTNEQWTYEVPGFPADRLLNTNDAGKLAIMVFNIADENFEDSTYPYYIVGYFSPAMQYYYDRNIIHIDCYDWVDRTGPDHGTRSFLMEGTIAHEYQHLLHNYVDSGESTWINEGLSDYSEMLTGYGSPDSHIAHFLATPDNSLTQWSDQGDINVLADYGAAASFIIYLNDHYGGSTIVSKLMQNQKHGTASVTAVLKEQGYAKLTFETVFNNWRLANLIHSGNGLYNYTSINLWEIGETSVRDILPNQVFDRSDADPTLTMEGNAIDGPNAVGEYGTDYLHVTPSNWLTINRYMESARFAGQSLIPADGWTLADVDGVDFWYSGATDLRDVWLTSNTMRLGSAPTTLQFDAKWDIEFEYDFGFVQISSNGGRSWSSLSYTYTSSDIAGDGMPEIAANLPGVTGEQADFVHVSIDLGAYAGMNVQLRFRYMTDWGTNYEGWYVGNITVGTTDITGSMHASYPTPVSVNWMVTMYFPATASKPMKIVDMPVNSVHDVGLKSLMLYSGYKEMYIAITPNHGPADYEFSVS